MCLTPFELKFYVQMYSSFFTIATGLMFILRSFVANGCFFTITSNFRANSLPVALLQCLNLYCFFVVFSRHRREKKFSSFICVAVGLARVTVRTSWAAK